MQNLQPFQGEIKAVLENCTGTPTAKLIALLEAAGITNSKDLAALIGVKVRAIQTARANPEKRTTLRQSAPHCAHHIAPAQPVAPESAPHCAETHYVAPRARVLDNNLLTNLEDSSEVIDNPLPPSKTKSKPKPEFGLAEARTAFDAYNETALRCGIPQAAKLTPDRQRKIIARLKDYGSDGWTRALANIEKSAFLTGENDRGWRANLEFLLQAASFAKLHDGGYGNGRHAPIVVAAAKNDGSRMMAYLNKRSLEDAR